ncbi:MAG: biotin-dependent carboxyltransferase family protein [Gammaproteobacteria bacterium]|nr:biotin-dependent carboxyltransferase family protein [Gammaproteobacteria bacterium]MDP2140294.1 biotin-dependent carboxyltransferase family protein [Gammaproteobacteria bacterium]MDP2346188.1 biotin-dependent carboxyltransferase family protein [Gammaproteobacteria bacterium]
MIEVLRCGALTTVQDLGRHGYRHLGVGQSGALDPIAVRQGNLLLGNPAEAAVLEISVGPLVLRFDQDCAVALTGSGFVATIDHGGIDLLPGHVAMIAAGDTVTLSKSLVPGARTYLAVAGGIDVPLVMGSRSTDINARFGGLHGRPLQTGDKLATGLCSTNAVPAKKGIRPLSPSHILRALPGPDYESFTAQSCEDFWNQAWRINHQSNRMGLRLSGHALELLQSLELLSAGVLPGDVQVPSSGLPIVLANDAQTIGGYPRIACVIQADLWQLAHVPPGTSVYFQQVTVDEAITALVQQRRYLSRMEDSLRSALREAC